jgi:hypothetical protein
VPKEALRSVIRKAGHRRLVLPAVAEVRNDRYYMDGLAGWRRFGTTLNLTGDLISGASFDITNGLVLNDAFIEANAGRDAAA